MHFCVAAALLDGDITLASFEKKRFLDPDVVDVMAKIELRENPDFTNQYPDVWNCRIVALTRSGERREVHSIYPKGHPKNPMNDGEVEDKFITIE